MSKPARLKLFEAARPFGGRRGAVRDALAGVTLASMNVPQLLGYARIAGMPVITGLYTALLVPIAFAMFGSSRHLVQGWTTLSAVPGHQTEPGVILYRFGADLFYANATRFADETRALVEGAPSPVRWLVIEADAITNVDYTAARLVLLLIEDLTRQKIGIAFARVSASLRADMDRHGVTAALGSDKLFGSRHEALAEVHSATGLPPWPPAAS